MTTTKTIYLEIEVEIEGSYSAGRPGTFYRSNGDPGDPPEPAEFEIHSVKWQGVDISPMLDKENFDWFALEEEILEDIENREPDDYDDDERNYEED